MPKLVFGLKFCFVSFFILLALTSYAAVSLNHAKDANDNPSVTLSFSNEDALHLYQQLEAARRLEGFVISSGAAGTTYLSSPNITCQKSNIARQESGKKSRKEDASWYHCQMTLGSDGLTKGQ